MEVKNLEFIGAFSVEGKSEHLRDMRPRFTGKHGVETEGISEWRL